jgi:hypothetical protein
MTGFLPIFLMNSPVSVLQSKVGKPEADNAAEVLNQVLSKEKNDASY